MEVVALASVVTSGVVGLGGAWVSVRTTAQNVALSRENRTLDRLEGAYLEVLQAVEAEGLWYDSYTSALLEASEP